jgi:FKBP-type peptidyl-prolyl cis-trans isomerase FkpA
MIRFFKVAFVFVMSLTIFSCNKAGDDPVEAYVVPLAEQKPIDDARIQDFFNKYDMDVDAGYNVTFKEITTTSPGTKIKDEFTIQTKVVNIGDVDHNLYYISFNQGGGVDKPTIVDSIFVCYKGKLLDNTTFDTNERNPVWFNFRDIYVKAWREIFPLFNACASSTENPDGTITYNNHGAGVMFLPSALGYYNLYQASIPAYSPLIFNFKLMKVNYVDNDSDHIDSKDEGWNPVINSYTQDTDGDGILDILDIDDDGDGIPTKTEIKNPSGGYYPFADIPLCSDGKKKHLSAACH